MNIFLTVLQWLAGVAIGGWVLWRWLRRSKDDPGVLISKWAVSGAILFLFVTKIAPMAREGGFSAIFAVLGAMLLCLVLAITWGANIGGLIARPFGDLYDGGDTEPEARPLYSRARARKIQGKFPEAADAVREELAKFPDDVEGQMLLAEIQVEHLNDLAGAHITIERLVNQPGHTPSQIAGALTALADWHVKFGRDTDSAGLLFERIMRLFPDTELATIASQRIAHLFAMREIVAQPRERPGIALKPAAKDLGLRAETASLRPVEETAGLTANKLVQHLERFPQDWEAREKLAEIYAEHYQRLDLAAGEFERLIAAPNQPAKHVVRWLNLIADWQLRLADDKAAARLTLQRIMTLYPKTAAAELAEARLVRLPTGPEKPRSQGIALGAYERDLGLKKRG